MWPQKAVKNDDFAHNTSTAWPMVPRLLSNPLFELDDSQWQKILRRPEYAKRRAAQNSKVKQLALALNYNMFWLFFWA